MSPENFPGRYSATNTAAVSSEWVDDTVRNLSLQELSLYCLWDPDQDRVDLKACTDSEAQLFCPSSSAPPIPDTYTSEETRAMVEHIARNPDSHGLRLWKSFHPKDSQHSQVAYMRRHFRHKVYFDKKVKQHLKCHGKNGMFASGPPPVSSLETNPPKKVGSSSGSRRQPRIPYTFEEKRAVKDFYKAHSHKYKPAELWREYVKLHPGRTPQALFWYVKKHKEIRGGSGVRASAYANKNYASYTPQEDQILTEFAQMHDYNPDLRWSVWEKFAKMHPTRRAGAWRRRYLNHILPRATRRSRNVGVKSDIDQTTEERSAAPSNSSGSFKERLEPQDEGDPKPNKQHRGQQYPDAAPLSLRKGTASETLSQIPLSSNSLPSGFPRFTDADLTAATEWIMTRQCPQNPEQNTASWRTFATTHSSHTHEQWVWYYYHKLDFFRKIERK